jgi:hypothetical protein
MGIGGGSNYSLLLSSKNGVNVAAHSLMLLLLSKYSGTTCGKDA